MKKLNKNFEIKKVTVESMASCACIAGGNCVCINHCSSIGMWTGLTIADAIAAASAATYNK